MLAPQPFAWGYFNSNINFTTAVPSATAYGTAFTAGASNADGSAVSLLTLAQDVQLITVAFDNTAVSGADTATLADLLVDPAGGTSWSSLIDDLVCGFLPATAITMPFPIFYTFPLFIKAGSSLGLRARCSHSSPVSGSGCGVWVWGQPNRPGQFWCGQGVLSLGINSASSSGTAVTSGTSNSWGSWTSIGTVTPRRIGALQMQANSGDSSQVTASYHFEVGYGSVRLPMPPTHLTGGTVEQRVCFGPWGYNPCDIPEGTQLQVRGMSGQATVDVWDVAIYGTY